MYVAKDSTPCQVVDAELWFSRPGSADARVACQMCTQCDERLDCLASTLKFESEFGSQPGIYGGLESHNRLPLLPVIVRLSTEKECYPL